MPDIKEMDLIKLMDNFASEERCREVLKDLRWPNGVASKPQWPLE